MASSRVTHWSVTGQNPDDYAPRVVRVAAGWIVANAHGWHYSRPYPTRAQAEAWLHGYNAGTSDENNG